MARGRTIIVGGGISASAPFTVGAIPVVVTADPPAVTDSIMTQAGTRITVAGDIQVGLTVANRQLFSEGGTTNGSLILGKNVTNLSNRGLAIGQDVAVPASIFSCIYIGYNSNLGATTNRSFIAIGEGINLNGAGGAKVYAIGPGHACTSGNGCLLLGEAITVSGAVSDIIALKAEAGSTTTTIAHSDVISLGGASSFGANQCLIGGGSIDIRTLVIGQGDTGGANTRTIRCSDASGVDVAQGNLTLIAPRSTGNAAAGQLTVQLGDRVAGSGSTLQSAFTAFSLLNDTGSVKAQLDSIAASTKNVIVEIYTAGALRAIIGAAGAAGGLVTGSLAGETVIRTQSQKLLFSLDGGTTVHALFNTSGVFISQVDRGLKFENQTSAAGAGAGTLGNAPTAGNPGHWLKINIGGTNYAIPCWAG